MKDNKTIKLEGLATATPIQAEINKLFDSSLWDKDHVFENNNYKYLWGFTIEGQHLYYKPNHIHLDDVLFYKETGDYSVKSVLMGQLMVFAVEEYWINKRKYLTIFYRCLLLGNSYSLHCSETDANAVDDALYA